MKKYYLIGGLVLLFVIAIGIVIFFQKNRKGVDIVNETEEEETSMIELPVDKLPILALTPSADGHYLNLKIDKIKVDGVVSMDYELLYDTSAGITQGVPGMADIKDRDSFEAELLLGSESSGKFRYDEGVEKGTITIWLRNDQGKLISKLISDFRLYSAQDEIISSDEKFSYKFEKTPKKGFFVVIQTLGVPSDYPGDINAIKYGPYGVFSSETSAVGKALILNQEELSSFAFIQNKWNDDLTDIGIFVFE